MNFTRRRFMHLPAGAAALSAIPWNADAQSYPSRPVTVIVPFPAGGPTDTVARIIAERIRPSIGQSVVVENVSGAGGTLGVTRVVRAAADGYVLSVGNWASHVGATAVYPVQYDVLRDLEPVAILAAEPQIIVARESFPANNLKELVEWLKANPDKALQSTVGVGSASHVAGLSFQKETGTRLLFVPYRGAAPAMQGLLGGEVAIGFSLASTATPHLQAGKIKAFAVTDKHRLAAAPDVPTVDEAGLPGFYFSVWTAIWAPKGTPEGVIGKLNDAISEALADTKVQQRLANLGQNVVMPEQRTPAALGAFHKSEIEKWVPIIRAANIKAE